jgi:hypothetical protein
MDGRNTIAKDLGLRFVIAILPRHIRPMKPFKGSG